ncbi:hypothetical protein STENM327S_02586 [Streptomyces tendae]
MVEEQDVHRAGQAADVLGDGGRGAHRQPVLGTKCSHRPCARAAPAERAAASPAPSGSGSTVKAGARRSATSRAQSPTAATITSTPVRGCASKKSRRAGRWSWTLRPWTMTLRSGAV